MVFWLERFAKRILSNMQYILSLRHSWLLAKHAMALGTVMLRCLVVRSFFVVEYISTCLLLPQDPNRSAAVRMRGRSNRINLLDFGYCHFPIIFDLNCEQEVTPIFMGKGMISLLIIPQLILHGWGESILYFKSNLIHREFFVADFPIICLINIAIHQRGR